MDTAHLMGLGEVTPLSVLNSFFSDYSKKEQKTEQLKHWLTNYGLETPLILVTHQVNITALTGVFPRSGEIIVVYQENNDRFKVLGRFDSK